MEYLIGVVLALSVSGLATLIGLDRGRSFYPTVLIVVAAYYPLFAVMGASGPILGAEIAIAAVFALLALFGFKKNMWWVAMAIAGHGIFDLVHHLVIQNPGMPLWWPGFCASADLVLGGWLAVLLQRTSRIPAS